MFVIPAIGEAESTGRSKPGTGVALRNGGGRFRRPAFDTKNNKWQ